MSMTEVPTRPEFKIVTFDLYRDVHKGIRAELFAVTGEAGRLDPAHRQGRIALDARVNSMVELLVQHALHEDTAVQPALEVHLPDLADQIAIDHATLEHRMELLTELAAAAVDASPDDRRHCLHHLYADLASFTGAYLAHQDVEERNVMPGLEAAIGVEAVVEIHQAILRALPPDQMADSLALMIPAMNIDDRTELLGGMQAEAPPEVFAGVWGLLQSLLDPGDVHDLGVRLGVD